MLHKCTCNNANMVFPEYSYKPVQTRGGVCNNIVVELEALRLLWCLSPYGGYFLLASWPPSQKTNICGNNFFDYFPRQSFLLPHWPPLRKCVIPA